MLERLRKLAAFLEWCPRSSGRSSVDKLRIYAVGELVAERVVYNVLQEEGVVGLRSIILSAFKTGLSLQRSHMQHVLSGYDSAASDRERNCTVACRSFFLANADP